MACGQPSKGERGAALVEYMLLIGLISIVAMTSMKALGATASSQFGAAAAPLAGTAGTAASSQAVSDGSGGGSTGTTTPPTTPPTTAPAPTTTTTTTTLPPVATQGSTLLTTPTTVQFGSYWWGTSQLVVTNNLGVPLSGARITLRFQAYTRQSNGTYAWVTTTQTLTTDSDGSISFYVGPYYGGSGTGQVTKATVAVSAVTLPNGLTWDGDPSTITVNSP
jgi:Flp pilus assembly pilin Flp